jgi:hypothetical protein
MPFVGFPTPLGAGSSKRGVQGQLLGLQPAGKPSFCGLTARPTARRRTQHPPPVLFFARTPSPQEKTYQARLCALVRGLS